MTTGSPQRLSLRGDTMTRCSGSVDKDYGTENGRKTPTGEWCSETLQSTMFPGVESKLGQVHGGLFQNTHNDGEYHYKKKN